MDGGVKHVVDVERAIKRCKEIVPDESLITVDVILLDDAGIDELNKNRKPESAGMNEVITSLKKHPKVNFRYLLAPSKK